MFPVLFRVYEDRCIPPVASLPRVYLKPLQITFYSLLVLAAFVMANYMLTNPPATWLVNTNMRLKKEKCPARLETCPLYCVGRSLTYDWSPNLFSQLTSGLRILMSPTSTASKPYEHNVHCATLSACFVALLIVRQSDHKARSIY